MKIHDTEKRFGQYVKLGARVGTAGIAFFAISCGNRLQSPKTFIDSSPGPASQEFVPTPVVTELPFPKLLKDQERELYGERILEFQKVIESQVFIGHHRDFWMESFSLYSASDAKLSNHFDFEPLKDLDYWGRSLGTHRIHYDMRFPRGERLPDGSHDPSYVSSARLTVVFKGDTIQYGQISLLADNALKIRDDLSSETNRYYTPDYSQQALSARADGIFDNSPDGLKKATWARRWQDSAWYRTYIDRNGEYEERIYGNGRIDYRFPPSEFRKYNIQIKVPK